MTIVKNVPQPRPLGRHYKIQLAAWLLGKSTKWINAKIADGSIEGFLLGKDVVVSENSINSYLDACRITGEPKQDPGATEEEE